ncbi:MAG: pirin family protein [Lachnospiraceae bacterium]|nr:pirin family protein [Lachnospiraceae bacterium]
MKKREIRKIVNGKSAVDGAGVRLVRVLGHEDTEDFDPFLMLDSFDSKNPDDYIKGFPPHPHRGIETLTYLIDGKIEHEDSLGNKDTINAGESQWMTAGSGIIHQEMPLASENMLGFQLWINLPANEKMTEPEYLRITEDRMGFFEDESSVVRVISGGYKNASGVQPRHVKASIFDIILKEGKSIEIETNAQENVFVFLIDGDGIINNKNIACKSAVLFSEGDTIEISSPENAQTRFIFFSGKSLKEPIAWGGPIVMNTKEELKFAFEELRLGNFIKSH